METGLSKNVDDGVSDAKIAKAASRLKKMQEKGSDQPDKYLEEPDCCQDEEEPAGLMARKKTVMSLFFISPFLLWQGNRYLY